MDDRIDEDEKEKEKEESLAGLTSLPPHRKAHSYSQQLRGTSTHKRHHHVRKHSLDDSRISSNIVEAASFYDCGEDDDILSRSSSTNNPAADEVYSEGADSTTTQYQPLQEFKWIISQTNGWKTH